MSPTAGKAAFAGVAFGTIEVPARYSTTVEVAGIVVALAGFAAAEWAVTAMAET